MLPTLLLGLLAASPLPGGEANDIPKDGEGFVWPSPVPQDCPFSKSTNLTGIFFTGRHSNYDGGDTRYPSWAGDGNLYSPWTDGATDKVACNSNAGERSMTAHAVMAGDDPLKLEIHNTASVAASTGEPVVAKEHYATRDNLKIYLWEKYQDGSLRALGRNGKVILLVHGATWSGKPDFDLQIGDYSLMDYLAKNGCDVWAIDIHGYGHSDKTDKDWSDTNAAARDIASAVDHIAKIRHAEKISILGWSWGALTGGLYTMQHPERVNRLILYGMVWEGNLAHRKLPIPKEQYRVNSQGAAGSDFIEGQYEPDVKAKYVREALATDPKSPNGAIVDLMAKLPILEPDRIKVPTLIIRPEKDFAAPESKLLEFFGKLGTKSKSYVALPDGGHAILLEKNHNMFQRAVLSFMNEPEAGGRK